MTDTQLMDWMEEHFVKLVWRNEVCHVWAYDENNNVGFKGKGPSLRAAIDDAAKGRA